MADLAARGHERAPDRVILVTHTLRYNRMHWLQIDAMDRHWERARVDATLDGEDEPVEIATKNVAGLTIHVRAGDGHFPVERGKGVGITVDGQTIEGPPPTSDGSWRLRLVKEDGRWTRSPSGDEVLAKRHVHNMCNRGIEPYTVFVWVWLRRSRADHI